MAAPPLDPAVIAEIRRLAAQGLSRNEIVRQVGCSRAAVTKYAPAGSFDRSATAAAVKAHELDMAARRAELAADLLEDAAKLRAQLWTPTVIYNFGGKDNTYNERPVDEPPFDAKRTLMQAASTALVAHLKLVEYRAKDDHGDAVEAIIEFGNQIRTEADDAE